MNVTSRDYILYNLFMDGPGQGPDQREGAPEQPDPRDHLRYAWVLGIDPGAFTELGLTEDDIKKIVRANFRLVSSRNHPDIKPNDPISEARMKLAGLAEKVLLNPTTREQYINRTGPYAKPQGRIIYGKSPPQRQ